MLQGLNTIGATCRKKRKALGWTQQELAERAGIHRTVISEIENGNFSGSLKSFTSCLTALGLMLTARATQTPQLDELETLFHDE